MKTYNEFLNESNQDTELKYKVGDVVYFEDFSDGVEYDEDSEDGFYENKSGFYKVTKATYDEKYKEKSYDLESVELNDRGQKDYAQGILEDELSDDM